MRSVGGVYTTFPRSKMNSASRNYFRPYVMTHFLPRWKVVSEGSAVTVASEETLSIQTEDDAGRIHLNGVLCVFIER